MTLAAVAGLAGAEFEIEFLDVDGVVRRGPLMRCWSERFEDVTPARSFPSYRGQRNFPGWWWSSTMERHVGYESRAPALSRNAGPALQACRNGRCGS